MKCTGPGCGVKWKCDMQHGVVDGRCTTCQLMAEAASNLNIEEVVAVLRTVAQAERRVPLGRRPAECPGSGCRCTNVCGVAVHEGRVDVVPRAGGPR